jgi:hypothetical protein
VDISPANGGTVERTTKELDADAPCSYPDTVSVDLGDDIIIEAVAASGYHFTGWSGEPTIDEHYNPLEIIFVNSISITANFVPDIIEFTSADGLLNLLIAEGTTALDAGDEPLTSVEFTADENPPSPREANIIGQAYNLEPDGATFEPPVTLTWEYTAADIPEGVAEENLVIAYYDENASEWVALDSDVDPIEAIIRASVEHLTTFAILAPAATPSPPAEATFTTTNFSISTAEVNPGNEVTISALITNQGQVGGSQDVTLKINGAIAETQNVTLSGGAFTVVTFKVIKNEVGTYSVDLNGFTGEFTVKEAVPNPPPSITTPPSTTTPSSTTTPPSIPSSGINWPVLAPILSAVFLAIFLPIKLRRRREGLDW